MGLANLGLCFLLVFAATASALRPGFHPHIRSLDPESRGGGVLSFQSLNLTVTASNWCFSVYTTTPAPFLTVFGLSCVKTNQLNCNQTYFVCGYAGGGSIGGAVASPGTATVEAFYVSASVVSNGGCFANDAIQLVLMVSDLRSPDACSNMHQLSGVNGGFWSVGYDGTTYGGVGLRNYTAVFSVSALSPAVTCISCS